jgi:uncharacterized protein (UPF0332 family)
VNDLCERQALIGYWLDKAERAVASAVRELQDGDLAFAVNRCYYACFYAFTAVLVRDGQFPRKHTMVRSFLNRDYYYSAWSTYVRPPTRLLVVA